MLLVSWQTCVIILFIMCSHPKAIKILKVSVKQSHIHFLGFFLLINYLDLSRKIYLELSIIRRTAQSIIYCCWTRTSSINLSALFDSHCSNHYFKCLIRRQINFLFGLQWITQNPQKLHDLVTIKCNNKFVHLR